jgi:benzoylformate decarboxylase
LRNGRFVIIEQLLADGIKYMFGNPGTVEQGFLDAISAYPDFKYILSLEESTAVAMADGYARKTKMPAVVQLHSGVGLGNGIGMLYQAMRGHAPLIVLSGEAGIKYDALEAHMAADLVSMAKPVTKWSSRVVDSSSLLRVLRKAIKIASTPPMGPVFVSLPMDILDMPNEEEVVPTTQLNLRTSVEPSQLEEVAEILVNAQSPAFIIGDGIAFSGAQQEITHLAELLGAEVWGAESTEVNMSASSPNYRKLLGHMFGKDSKVILSKSDVVLITGTYIFPEVFPSLKDAFAPRTKVIHIDLNAYEIAKNFPVDIGIVSDPKVTLANLNSIVERVLTPERKQSALQRNENFLRQKKEKRSEELKKDEASWNSSHIHPSRFMYELSKCIPPDTLLFDEALTCSPDLTRYLPADNPGSFFQTRSFSLGVGIPGAVGLKIAAPQNTVIGFAGDGASMYTIQALWTASHYKIGAKFVILNNYSYRLLQNNILQYWNEKGIEKHAFPECFSIQSPQLNFVKLSEGMGVPAVRVEAPDEIKPAIERMLNTEGPFLIDLIVKQS